jgi:lipopolysaccharide biosynthesis protein
MGLGDLPQHFNFPVGTMFWARTSALEPLIGLHLQWDDYPPEPLPYDGTLLHAVERLLPFTLRAGMLRSATTNVAGVTR